MRTYIRSITTFFRWTHRDSLFLCCPRMRSIAWSSRRWLARRRGREMQMSDKPPIEVRVFPDGDRWTVEGWRGGEQRYTRLFNRTADEAWHYGAEWMRGEMMKNAKETK